MSFDKVENCPKCGNIYMIVHKRLCPDCIKKVEQEYQRCAQFLRKRENRSSTMAEMSEQTGVSVDQITDFIREKRLLVEHHPNLGYPCQSCGCSIRAGQVCDSCAQDWRSSIDQMGDQKNQGNAEKGNAGYLNRDAVRRST